MLGLLSKEDEDKAKELTWLQMTRVPAKEWEAADYTYEKLAERISAYKADPL